MSVIRNIFQRGIAMRWACCLFACERSSPGVSPSVVRSWTNGMPDPCARGAFVMDGVYPVRDDALLDERCIDRFSFYHGARLPTDFPYGFPSYPFSPNM